MIRNNTFKVDKQTVSDLNIFEEQSDQRSIFSIFNQTKSIGGKELLHDLFQFPLTSSVLISQRIALIKYLGTLDLDYLFDKESLDFIEYYLRQNDRPLSVSRTTAWINSLIFSISPNQAYYLKERAVAEIIDLLKNLNSLSVSVNSDLPPAFEIFSKKIFEITSHPDFEVILKLDAKKLTAYDIEKCDYLFRNSEAGKVKELLEVIYELDAFSSVAKTATQYGFTHPIIDQSNHLQINFKDICHPLVENSVSNEIEFTYDKNLCFITGPNMAGKSTLLKSIGISIYLAHMGFPVPAKYMKTSIFQGLTTTINLSDNISQGYSHFYNEVLRIKQVAEDLRSHQNIVVIFDELFRGTNVKDAYDASLIIIRAFSKVRSCFFLISTHIVEVAEGFSDLDNIDFKYLGATIKNGRPEFSYKLKNGITAERLGMWIVENEKIIDIIEEVINHQISGNDTIQEAGGE